MRTTISRCLAIAAGILLSLALALPLFMGTSQEAFASTQVHTFSSTPHATEELWLGTAKYSSGGSGFSMQVEVLIQGCGCFSGTLYEATYHSKVDIQGHSAQTGGIGFGTFRFTSTQLVYGNMCVGCSYRANYDNPARARMSGVWFYSDGIKGGTFILYLDEP